MISRQFENLTIEGSAEYEKAVYDLLEKLWGTWTGASFTWSPTPARTSRSCRFWGCWAIGGPFWADPVGWGKVDDDESIRAVHRALELGVNFFDTADAKRTDLNARSSQFAVKCGVHNAIFSFV
jgi:hypothetical protein